MNYEELLRTDALNLLREQLIVATLSRIGKVELDGAVAYRLTYARDIDLIVRPAAATGVPLRISVLAALGSNTAFTKFKFVDNTDQHVFGKPCGIWIGLATEYRKKPWTIDIWIIPDNAVEIAQLVPLTNDSRKSLMHLAKKDRAKILQLKRHVHKNHPHSIKSSLIYQAYLERGIRTEHSLEQYIKAMGKIRNRRRL